MHLKRSSTGKFWSIPRKGTKYLAVPTHNKNEGVPLIVVTRNIFKIVENRKELKKLLNDKKIKINHKEVRNVNYPVCLFDVISIPSINKNYRAYLSKQKKIIFKEINEKESKEKTFKVIGKKILSGKKLQLNLMHGKNLIIKEKVNVDDSVILDLSNNNIVKIIPMEKGKNAFVMKGKHTGIEGKIEEIIERGGKKLTKIILDDKKINVWVKNIIMVE
jgi:small subunit ribosomal protein S4e